MSHTQQLPAHPWLCLSQTHTFLLPLGSSCLKGTLHPSTGVPQLGWSPHPTPCSCSCSFLSSPSQLQASSAFRCVPLPAPHLPDDTHSTFSSHTRQLLLPKAALARTHLVSGCLRPRKTLQAGVLQPPWSCSRQCPARVGVFPHTPQQRGDPALHTPCPCLVP